MAPSPKLIKDVDKNNRHSLKLRVVRLFKRAGFQNRDKNTALEIIFHDHEGGRVTAVIKNRMVPLFENRFLEGRVYKIGNYHLENNSGKFLTSIAKFRLVFHQKTLILELSEESFFPNYMFDFRDLKTLVDPLKVDETILFDVVGRVTQIHNPQEKEFYGKKARLIEIVLEDNSEPKNTIHCTLWGSYVDEILAFESSLTADVPIIILQMCRAKVFRDKVTLTNSFEVTKIHTLKTIPAIESFKKEMKEEDLDTKSISRGSLTLSRLELDDLTAGKVKIRPLEDFYDVDHECTLWICAVVGQIIGDWWYLACTRCHRKLKDSGDDFFCDGCKKDYSSGVYRYKLHLDVMDNTANMSLLIWDREAEKLIGRSCHDLRLEFLESREQNDDEYPGDLGRLLDKTFLFKVTLREYQVHNSSSLFTVSRLVTDESLVGKYNKWTVQSESDSDDMQTLLMDAEKVHEMDSEEEVTTPAKLPESTKIPRDSETIKRLMFEDDYVDSNSNKKRAKNEEIAEDFAGSNNRKKKLKKIDGEGGEESQGE